MGIGPAGGPGVWRPGRAEPPGEQKRGKRITWRQVSCNMYHTDRGLTQATAARGRNPKDQKCQRSSSQLSPDQAVRTKADYVPQPPAWVTTLCGPHRASRHSAPFPSPSPGTRPGQNPASGALPHALGTSEGPAACHCHLQTPSVHPFRGPRSWWAHTGWGVRAVGPTGHLPGRGLCCPA